MKSIEKPHVTIIDRPCGTGKTSKFIREFDPEKSYLVVTPYITEVDRIVREAGVPFFQPSTEGDNDTKGKHLEELLAAGCNVATTHELFHQINPLARRGYLEDHHIIIDEVLAVCRAVVGKNQRSFQRFYLEDGYATVDDDGKVTPTAQWDAEFAAVSDTLDLRLYRLAKAGMLHVVDNEFFMWVLPEELLRAGRSISIYTYLAEGSMLLAYLRKQGIPYTHDTDPECDREFREKAKELITIEAVPSLARQRFSYSAQTNRRGCAAREKKVSGALKKLREGPLREVPLDRVLITCVKSNWYKDGKSDIPKPKPGGFSTNSRMFTKAQWIPNTTRGTNLYSECSHLIYLYNQHINPYMRRWLDLSGDKSAGDRYALTELIQWIYRSRVRKGDPITVYLPSKRMRDLLTEWMHEPVEREAWTGQLVHA